MNLRDNTRQTKRVAMRTRTLEERSDVRKGGMCGVVNILEHKAIVVLLALGSGQ